MNVVFFGTGDFGCDALAALAKSRHRVLSVVASPDRPRGRFLRSQPSGLRRTAQSLGLDVYPFEKEKEAEALDHVRALQADFFVVVSFGRLLNREFLAAARIAPLNIHPSLLPRHRGASPVQWTLLEGDAETGVTIIRMNERLDAGDIAAQEAFAVRPDHDLRSLTADLSALGAGLLVRTLDAWEAGGIRPVPQDESRATYTRKFAKEDGRLDFSLDAETLARRVRALQGWPGVYTSLRGRRVLAFGAEAAGAEAAGVPPGTVTAVSASRVGVAAARGTLVLTGSLQLEGRNALPIADFLRGFPVKPGDRFE